MTAGRLLRRIVGPSPEKPPGKVTVVLVPSAFVVWCSLTVVSGTATPPFPALPIFCLMTSAVLSTFGNVAAHRHWRGGLPGDLLRLGAGVPAFVGLVLLVADSIPSITRMGLSGWSLWIWLSAVFLTVIIVAVAGWQVNHPNDGPSSEVDLQAKREQKHGDH